MLCYLHILCYKIVNRTIDVVLLFSSFCVKLFSYVEFALRFSINDCPYSVGFEAIGASSDELIVCNGCKEVFSAVVASYDYVNF